MLTHLILCAAVVVVSASAQSPLTCLLDNSTTLIRAEGLSELVPDTVMTCTGGAAGAVTTLNLVLRFGHYGPNGFNLELVPASGASGALLIVDDLAAPAVLGGNVIPGTMQPDGSISFLNIPFVVPQLNQKRTFRFTNLRVNASQALMGRTLMVIVSNSDSVTLPIGGAPPDAIPVRGLNFALEAASGGTVSGLTFQQSGGSNITLFSSPNAPGGVLNYDLSFAEGFAASFKKRNVGTTISNPNAIADQSTLGTVYNTESGYYDGAFSTANSVPQYGLATQGTRLMARFSNVPANVVLYVTTSPLGNGGATGARLVSNSSTTGGPANLVTPTTTVTVGGSFVGIAPVALSGGSGTAIWEVLDSDSSALETFRFGIVVAYLTPQTGSATVRGNLAPVAVGTGDSSSPVPAFADTSPDAACSTSPCLTVTPTAISISYQTGAAAPASVPLQVTSTVSPVSYTVAASSPDALNWLLVSVSSNTTPGLVTVNFNPVGMAAGTYSGTIIVSSGNTPPVSIPVLLTITNGAGVPPPMQCSLNVAAPPQIRAEGLRELAGDLVLLCTGGTVGATYTKTIQITSSVPITSKSIGGGLIQGTEAVVLIDEPGSFFPGSSPGLGVGTTVFQGTQPDPYHLVFSNIPVRAPASGGVTGISGCPCRILRITNVRLDARTSVPGTSPISLLVTMSGTSVFGGGDFAAPSTTAAFDRTSLAVSLLDSSKAAVSGPLTFSNATSNPGLYASSAATGGVVTNYLNFAEQFAAAFKNRNLGTSAATPLALVNQDTPGAFYPTETGFYSGGLTGGLAVAGLATQGTRLMTRFSNVPPGVKLYVTVTPTSITPTSTRPTTAQLVATDVVGAGAFSAIAPTSTITLNGSTVGIAPVAVSGGSGTAVWEILDANPNTPEQVQFGLLAAYLTPQPSAAVDSSFAPIGNTPLISSGTAVPSFVEMGNTPASMISPVPGSAITINSWPFMWTSGSNVTSYRLTVGNSPGAGEFGDITTSATSTVVSALPADGRTLYVRLSSLIAGVWQNRDYTFTSATTTSGLRFVPITPCRVLDTRGATGNFGGPNLAAGGIRAVAMLQSACNIPSNAQAYSLNLTAVPLGPLTYLSIWPAGQPQPYVSTLNALDGRIAANAAIVPAGSNGSVSLYASDATHAIVDINGYFVPASSAGALSFYTATPCRLVDTRGNSGPFGGPFLAGGSTRSFTIPAGACALPTSAQAYSLNITVVPRGPLGYLTTWPAGLPQPNASTLNSLDGSVVANAAIVPAGAGGAISLFVTDSTDVIIDINGYFAPPGSLGALSLYSLTPCRVLDTRNGAGPFGGPVVAGGVPRAFAIPSSGCGVPSAAQAYSVNVTAVPPGSLTYVTAWPTGQPQPYVSTLNSFQGKVVANAAIVPAGTAGSISLFASDPSQLILDINAYFAQ